LLKFYALEKVHTRSLPSRGRLLQHFCAHLRRRLDELALCILQGPRHQSQDLWPVSLLWRAQSRYPSRTHRPLRVLRRQWPHALAAGNGLCSLPRQRRRQRHRASRALSCLPRHWKVERCMAAPLPSMLRQRGHPDGGRGPVRNSKGKQEGVPWK
jgi:hypothetical protein